jgi:hypothetical protein
MTGPTALATFQTGRYPVTASDPYYWVSLVHVSWGDGLSESPIDWVNNRQYPYPCSAEDLAPSPRELAENDLRHAWRQPGTYVVEAMVSSWRCGFDAPMATRRVRVTVVVEPGEVSSNGPQLPDLSDLEIVDTMARIPGRLDVSVYGDAEDLDGHITRVAVDWGDGTTTTLPPNDHHCSDGGGRYYPEGEYAEHVNEKHEYAVRGEYTIVVHVTSTGCDGLSPQETSRSFAVGTAAASSSPSPASATPSPSAT